MGAESSTGWQHRQHHTDDILRSVVKIEVAFHAAWNCQASQQHHNATGLHGKSQLSVAWITLPVSCHQAASQVLTTEVLTLKVVADAFR